MIILIISAVAIAIFVSLIFFRIVFAGGNRKLKEGMRLESAGRYQEALSIYDYILKNEYASPELRWKIANIALKINNIQRSQKELMVLIQTKNPPANVTLLAVKILLSECYIKSGLLKEAFVELFEIIKNAPENFNALLELAKIYAGQRKTEKAIKLFEKCLQLNPNFGEVNYLLGKAYLDIGIPVKALEYFEKTEKLKYYDHGRLNYYMGILYFGEKKFDIAIQNFIQVIKLRQSDNRLLSDSHHLIALCYKEKGLVDEAITNFEKSQVYSELLPQDAQSKRALYNQGVLFFKQGNYQLALEKFYKVKMLDYKYKDVDNIIKTITSKLRSGERLSSNLTNFISENPLVNILRVGLLYSKIRFNIDTIEAEVSKNISIDKDSNTQGYDGNNPYNSINKFNALPSKSFKDLARRIIPLIGFQIKSEPKFFGDDEYIDGNAINFYVFPVKNMKIKKDILITIRRYKEPITELSVSRFLDWIDDNHLEQGIFIGSSTFSSQALKVIQTAPTIKFIDRAGLAKILGRIT